MDIDKLLKLRAEVEAYLPELTRLGSPPLQDYEKNLQVAQDAVAGLRKDVAELERAAAERKAAAEAARAALKSRGAAPQAAVAPHLAVQALPRVQAAKAADICRSYPASESALALLNGDPSPREFLQRLLDRNLLPEALRFLAHALPIREAAWWACLCLRLVLGPVPAALRNPWRLAVEWLLEPHDERRRAVQVPAEELGLKSPLGCILMAVHWSGGSLTAPAQPAVAPRPGMAGQAVAGAVLLAAVQGPPDAIPRLQRQFVSLGIEVANGKVPWK